MSFASLQLPEPLLRAVSDLGFTIPTPIQLQAIPPALAGRDVVACAMTGSGKTAAFVLPILARLGANPPAHRTGGPRCLVLSPTRELAAQTAVHFEELARHTRLKGAAVFGGVSMGPQERAFKSNVEVLVATPGRLLDHLQHPYARLDGVEILVLDEADRMLDMGFLPDIRRVLSKLPRERQNLLFSATMPPPIAALTREMLKQPVEIAVDRQSKPATGITQSVYPVREELKPYLLLELLRREEIQSVIVFTRTKHRANRLAERLMQHGVSCERIHGNRSQAQRTDALARFKDGRIRVLVATDIAARGIDVEALSHVLNFDVPNVPDDYIHRVGRTARAEATGDAWTFVSDAERTDLAAIERAIGARLPRLTVSGFDYEHKPAERFEKPLAERIAEIRAKKAEDRARSAAKAERKAAMIAAEATRSQERTRSAPPRAAQPRPTAARPPAGSGHGSAGHGSAGHGSAGHGFGGHGASSPGGSHRPGSSPSGNRPAQAAGNPFRPSANRRDRIRPTRGRSR